MRPGINVLALDGLGFAWLILASAFCDDFLTFFEISSQRAKLVDTDQHHVKEHIFSMIFHIRFFFIALLGAELEKWPQITQSMATRKLQDLVI